MKHFEVDCEFLLKLSLMSFLGNIRVFCRVRPFLPVERHARPGPLTAPNVDWVKVPSARKEFEFDKVFHPNSVQGTKIRLPSFSFLICVLRVSCQGRNSNLCT